MWIFGRKAKEEPAYSRKTVSIRMEAIGGQGANSAGKIFAEAAVLGKGYTGNHFSSFGSEKKGTPVKSFVRFSTEGKIIRTASYIKHPDILVIFHESLLQTHPECLDGIDAHTDLLINSTKSPDEIQFPQGFKVRKFATVDATSLALKHECGLNAVMLGAITKFCSEVPADLLLKTFLRFFAHLPEQVQKNNSEGFEAGIKKTKEYLFDESQASVEKTAEILPKLGWENAPLGGLIVNPGNTVLKDNSASRKGLLPRFLPEICFNCGYCDMVCPDYCFVWEIDPAKNPPPQLKGIDYQYCKGCQKCVVACPVQALVTVPEGDLTKEERSQHLFPHLHKRDQKD
ncbi:2-oxoacid:acceptor oxidoreductase family protein [Bdellovibrio sp. ArHS]|uniref:2-oxoacid:acceptor oxidoreductase family protein n=1 Tax=Bdellovibrio sp. ArHS TaxID=1569284 RepID=UPI0025BA4D13|nr:2-oxoacid:acceptor oxidoreductase family protein [Bdellovibrio sp. ArHS]